MAVTSISLTNFRSYAERTVPLSPQVTVIVGPNATGKTNPLESLFVLATTKSFRAKDAELTHHGQDFFRIVAVTDEGEVALGYQQTDRGTEKKAFLDGVKRTATQHIGTLRTVIFEPNDLQLVLGSPDRRRKYLDFILTQTNPAYLSTLHRYRRVLQQRNRLLSEWHGQESELFAWNVKLTELASDIDSARRQLINHINSLSSSLYLNIAGTPEQLDLIYIGSIPDSQDYSSRFMQELESSLTRDIGAGFTTIGPHRDDFDIKFKGADITAVASRGEMRTVVLVLKLAEMAYIEQVSGQSPILLLDDVFSELDEQRRAFLIKTLTGKQSLITTTDADIARQLEKAEIIHMRDIT